MSIILSLDLYLLRTGLGPQGSKSTICVVKLSDDQSLYAKGRKVKEILEEELRIKCMDIIDIRAVGLLFWPLLSVVTIFSVRSLGAVSRRLFVPAWTLKAICPLSDWLK